MTQQKPFPIAPRPSLVQPSSSAELALTLLGPSPAMAQLWTQIRRLAPYLRTVLLTGEADCGQEAVARLLLDLSPQNHRHFLQLTAAEVEGRLLRASGLASFPPDVLLYLPDVHRLSRPAQEAVLRLLKMRRSRPFTTVAAAADDLRTLVGLGSFSSELADLLGGMRIALPTLKQRAEDLPMLIVQLLSQLASAQGTCPPTVSETFLRAAMAHTWPGNFRELSQVLASLNASAGTEPLQASDLQRTLAVQKATVYAEPAAVRMVSLDAIVQEHIAAVLHACHGNKLRAAETLGISRSTLYRMLDCAAATRTPALQLAG